MHTNIQMHTDRPTNKHAETYKQTCKQTQTYKGIYKSRYEHEWKDCTITKRDDDGLKSKRMNQLLLSRQDDSENEKLDDKI